MIRRTSTHSKWISFFLILIFIGPLIVAVLFYNYRDAFHFKTLNKGKLLSPPIDSKTVSFFNKDLLGKWQFIYVDGKGCNKECEMTLSALNKIHAALGKDRVRVKTRRIKKDETDPPLQELTEGSIAIIDPRGFIMMLYPPNTDLKNILRDMRRLLRISHG